MSAIKRVVIGPKYPYHTWKGISGLEYKYQIFPTDKSFDEVDGNYIYAKLVGLTWVPIYIGQGNLAVRISDNHHKAEEITEKGATHIHAHENSQRAERFKEESDILNNYSMAFTPIGCNEELGPSS